MRSQNRSATASAIVSRIHSLSVFMHSLVWIRNDWYASILKVCIA